MITGMCPKHPACHKYRRGTCTTYYRLRRNVSNPIRQEMHIQGDIPLSECKRSVDQAYREYEQFLKQLKHNKHPRFKDLERRNLEGLFSLHGSDRVHVGAHGPFNKFPV